MKNISIYLSRGWYGDSVKIGRKDKRRGVEVTGKSLSDKKVKVEVRKKILEELRKVEFQDAIEKYWIRRDQIQPLQSGSLVLTLSSPLAIGMGNSLPLDIPGITLHRNYGFPYIPGSAVRGMVRYVVSMVKKYRVSGKDKETFSMVERLLFGNYYENELKPSKTRGVVHFLSVVPEKDQEDYRLLEPDIINNHHQKYYTGDNPPVDTENPVPVYFIRVKAGTKFHFAWVIEDEDTVISRWEYITEDRGVGLDDALLTFFGMFVDAFELDDIPPGDILNLISGGVKELLVATAKYYGFGAKTRVGYGRMKESKKS